VTLQLKLGGGGGLVWVGEREGGEINEDAHDGRFYKQREAVLGFRNLVKASEMDT